MLGNGESNTLTSGEFHYNLQSETDSCITENIPLPKCKPTKTSTANHIQVKKRSVFADRQRMRHSQEKLTADDATSYRTSFPEIEQVTTPVIKSDIIERTGAVQPPITTSPFPVQPLGFPVASHRSKQPIVPKPPTKSPAALGQVLSPKPGSFTGEQLDIHRNAMQLIADYDDVQINETLDHVSSSLRPEIVSMLLKRAEAKYKCDSLTDSPTPKSSSDSTTQNIPQPTDLKELKKLEWTKDIDTNSEPDPIPTNQEDPNDPLTQTSTIPGSLLRFDLTGILLDTQTDIPMHLGLHHHSQHPDKPGYSIPELVHLLRSRFSAQRLIAVKVLGEIITLVWQTQAYGPQTSVVLACIHATGAIVQLRGLVLDTNTSVCLHTLIALYELVKPGLDAVNLNKWAGVHTVVMNPVLLVANNNQSEDEPACDTMADHTRNFKSNVPGGLLAMDLVPDLCKLLDRQQQVLTPLVLNILGIMCIQMQHACKQIITEYFKPVLAHVFKSLDAFITSPTLCSASKPEIEHITVIIQLLRMLVLYDPELIKDQDLCDNFNLYLLKMLSFPATLIELHPVVIASMQFALTLINYGDSTHVQEILQILQAHHLKCPGTYAIARAIKTHVPDLAILTVPIVDHAYFYLQTMLTPAYIAKLQPGPGYELLIETGSLVAARNVTFPVNDLMGVINGLVQVILTKLEQMTNCESELVNYLQHRPDQDTFQVFPHNTGPLISVVCDTELTMPIQLLELLLRQFSDLSVAETILETIKSTLILPVLQSGHLLKVAMLVSILVTYISHNKDQLADPADNLIAYYAVTYLNVPREHHLMQLKTHLLSITATDKDNSVWHRILHLNSQQEVHRPNLYLSLPLPSIDRLGAFPSTIERRTWLLAPSMPASVLDLYTVSQWHGQLNLVQLPWLTSSDLASIFLDPTCPYLTFSKEMTHLCLHTFGGISDLIVFDMVMDAFINLSYFAPVFQIYLISVLFDSLGTDTVRVQFFTQMYEAGTLSRLRLTDATNLGDLTRFRLSSTSKDLNQMFRVALKYVPKESVWYRVIAMQEL